MELSCDQESDPFLTIFASGLLMFDPSIFLKIIYHETIWILFSYDFVLPNNIYEHMNDNDATRSWSFFNSRLYFYIA